MSFSVSTLPPVVDTERVEYMHLQQLQQEATSVRNLTGMLEFDVLNICSDDTGKSVPFKVILGFAGDNDVNVVVRQESVFGYHAVKLKNAQFLHLQQGLLLKETFPPWPDYQLTALGPKTTSSVKI